MPARLIGRLGLAIAHRLPRTAQPKGIATIVALRSSRAALRGDYVMALNRLVAGVLMLVGIWLLGGIPPVWTTRVVIWIGGACLLLVMLHHWPVYARTRRILGIGMDVGGATLMLAAGGPATAFVYMVYLWVIVGNGVRFGGKFLFLASAASLLGFGCVVFTVPFWHDNLNLAVGLLSGLVILPVYSGALVRQLAEARERAEDANRAKTLFLAGVSHELRTPLNAIIGTTELLQATDLDASQTEMLAVIASAADGQLALVSDVLEFSRTEAGGQTSHMVGFDLVALLNAVRSVASVEARRKGLPVNTYITTRTPLRLHGNERHLREVLLNLCSNAAKFTQSGSITIAADGVLGREGRVQLRLEVMDTGIGITEQGQARVFELFQQADATILDRFGGTGIGLALCRQRIDNMGGRIGVNSVVGQGSTFWVDVGVSVDVGDRASTTPDVVFLPIDLDLPWSGKIQTALADCRSPGLTGPSVGLVRDADPPPLEADILVELAAGGHGLPRREVRERFCTSLDMTLPPPALRHAIRQMMAITAGAEPFRPAHRHAPAPESVPMRAATTVLPGLQGTELAGLRVLVADDNAVNRSVAAKMLERAGAAVVMASDGEQALNLLSDGGIDVGLIDVNMPVMSGVEAAQLYQFTQGELTPLVCLTADGSRETRERVLDAGFATCLLKPVRSAELTEVVRRYAPANRGKTPPPPKPMPEPPAKRIGEGSERLDLRAIDDLLDLGGTAFLDQIVDEFRHDGSLAIAQLESAFAARDLDRFRTESHSLCSIAANMGARSVNRRCASWKGLPEARLDAEGDRMLDELRDDWRLSCDELASRLQSLRQPGA